MPTNVDQFATAEDSVPTVLPPLRVAFCQVELQPFLDVTRDTSSEAACLQQGYIAAGLATRGHRLTFLGSQGLDEVVVARGGDKPVPVGRTWSSSFWFETVSRNAWRVQRAVHAPYLNVFSNYQRMDAYTRVLPGHDLVHERNGLYNAGVAMACRRLGLPYVMFFDADQIAEHDFQGIPIGGLQRWRAQRLLQFNLQTARAVICVSNAARDRLTQIWHVPEAKIAVFPNAVDVARFRPSETARSQVRAVLGLGGAPVTIFVGNFHAWHDVATLLDAIEIVRNTHPDARLLLVGDGPNKTLMERRANERGLAASVNFLGAVPHVEVPHLIAAADVAVAPAPVMDQESWLSPMKLFEYMASGAAIVASGTGQASTVLDDGGSALLIRPGDASAMANAIATLLGNPALRARLGKQARKAALERHSWDGYVQRLERLYAAALAGDPVDRI